MAVKFKGRSLNQDKAIFTHRNVVNLFIFYELNTWSKYFHYGIGFDARLQISLLIREWGKNVIFSVDNSSSRRTNNTKKDILVLGEGATDGLHYTTVTAEDKYIVDITSHHTTVTIVLCSQQFFCMQIVNKSINSNRRTVK